MYFNNLPVPTCAPYALSSTPIFAHGQLKMVKANEDLEDKTFVPQYTKVALKHLSPLAKARLSKAELADLKQTNLTNKALTVRDQLFLALVRKDKSEGGYTVSPRNDHKAPSGLKTLVSKDERHAKKNLNRAEIVLNHRDSIFAEMTNKPADIGKVWKSAHDLLEALNTLKPKRNVDDVKWTFQLAPAYAGATLEEQRQMMRNINTNLDGLTTANYPVPKEVRPVLDALSKGVQRSMTDAENALAARAAKQAERDQNGLDANAPTGTTPKTTTTTTTTTTATTATTTTTNSTVISGTAPTTTTATTSAQPQIDQAIQNRIDGLKATIDVLQQTYDKAVDGISVISLSVDHDRQQQGDNNDNDPRQHQVRADQSYGQCPALDRSPGVRSRH